MPDVGQGQIGASGLHKDSPAPVSATATCSWMPREATLIPLLAHWAHIHVSRLPGPRANAWAHVEFPAMTAAGCTGLWAA